MPARIVVVHDEPVFVDGLVSALSSAGHQVAVFSDPLAAWDALAAAQKTEVLITRVPFPPGKSNGVALARMAHVNRPQIQVVFISSPEFESDGEGEGTFLPVPVNASQIVKTVDRLLRQQREKSRPTMNAGSKA